MTVGQQQSSRLVKEITSGSSSSSRPVRLTLQQQAGPASSGSHSSSTRATQLARLLQPVASLGRGGVPPVAPLLANLKAEILDRVLASFYAASDLKIEGSQVGGF